MVRTKAEAKRSKGAPGSSRVPKKDGGSKNPGAGKLKVTKSKSTKKGRLVAKKPGAKTTDVDDSSKTRIKKRRGQKALREIRKEQDCRDRPSTLKASKAIPYASFKRCVKDILQDMSGTGRNAVTSISPKAVCLLKTDAEEYMRKVFSLAVGVAASRKSQKPTDNDLRFSNNILMNPHILCERGGTERLMKKSASGRKSSTNKKEVDPTPAPKETPKEKDKGKKDKGEKVDGEKSEKEKVDEEKVDEEKVDEDEKMDDEEDDKDEVFEDAE